MKIMVSFLSLVIVFLGITHLFSHFIIPNKETGYAMVLIVAGILILLAAFMNSLLMGLEKFFLVLQGILLIAVAILQFIPSFLPFLPRAGFLYAGMVIFIGAIGLLYGFLGMG